MLDKITERYLYTTNKFVFAISKARFDSQPAWDPAKQPVPLEMDEVRQIARAWIQKQPWAKQFNNSEPLILNLGHDRSYKCWFYLVNLTFGQLPWGPNPPDIVVLLDGSVVEPKAVKEGTP